jgi:hypothetical protein
MVGAGISQTQLAQSPIADCAAPDFPSQRQMLFPALPGNPICA